MKLVLTGFMGTGKTHVGRHVAARLARPFVDTDELVEREEGLPVREIFARFGEKHFRERERRAVERACATPEAVIATGGGALNDPINFALLADSSLMICLTATPQAIARRVRATVAERPLLAGADDLTARIEALLSARAATYARVPVHVDTTSLSPEQVSERILTALSQAERGERQSDPSGGGERGP